MILSLVLSRQKSSCDRIISERRDCVILCHLMLYSSSMVDGQWTRSTEDEHRFMLWQVVT